jgi:hypothetical protein
MLKHLESGPDTPERQKLQERANKTLAKLNLTNLDLDEYERKSFVFPLLMNIEPITALGLIARWSMLWSWSSCS